mmetsp:Transcript_88690/g.194338  ORF Transcript_88690/g.194338 Transcript_88690/m.194338 type:complete len:81 (+) Transcript_88690:102-344(+)
MGPSSNLDFAQSAFLRPHSGVERKLKLATAPREFRRSPGATDNRFIEEVQNAISSPSSKIIERMRFPSQMQSQPDKLQKS